MMKNLWSIIFISNSGFGNCGFEDVDSGLRHVDSQSSFVIDELEDSENVVCCSFSDTVLGGNVVVLVFFSAIC